MPARGRRHGGRVVGGVVRPRGLRPPPPPGPPDAGADQPGPAPPARTACPVGVEPAAVGRRTRRRHLARHVPLRGGLPGLGRDRRPRPAVRHRRHLRTHRPGPRQGPHRPRHPAGDRRRPGRPHHPRLDQPGTSPGLVEVAAPGTAEPVLVDRGWLAQAGRARVAACDPVTGALLDEGESLPTGAYRPSKRLAALVRARDGRCRFPGCHVAARFCDLDHVTPWPAGPTTATNLACLCRRHHRVKQRPGWTAQPPPRRDPHLDRPHRQGARHPPRRPPPPHPAPHQHRPPRPDQPAGIPCLTLPDAPHSTLDHRVEHHLGTPRPRPTCRTDTHDLTPRRLTATLPTPHRRPRHPWRAPTGDPPF